MTIASGGAVTFSQVPVFPDNTIETADIQDNAITLAKLAGGTDGNIISFDASGDPVAIATGSDGQVLTSTGAGSPPAFEAIPASGISCADFWRLNADVQFGTGVQVLDGYWERADTDSPGVIGVAAQGQLMAESNGEFTFPTAGIWLIQHQVSIVRTNGEIQRHDSRIAMTTNNSSFDDAAFSHMSTDAANYRQSTCFSFIFDCVNVGTHKIKFTYNDVDDNNPTLVGATNATCTGAMFVRLGDT